LKSNSQSQQEVSLIQDLKVHGILQTLLHQALILNRIS